MFAVVRFVMYIDDLDRCSDGKSVMILEAVQLLFNETSPKSSSTGLLTEYGGWLVFCAKVSCWWLRVKAWFKVRLPAWCGASSGPTSDLVTSRQ